MYTMSGPEMLTRLKVNDYQREAERIHRVSEGLRELSAARKASKAALAGFRKGFALVAATLHIG
jgi:hypothetical protein